jgi:proteasome lid subunit RPN8/RPN11
MSSLDTRAIDQKGLKDEAAPVAKQELRVFVTEGAFDRAVERGGADTTREIGGVLVGELLKDKAGPYLRVDATIDALHAEEKGAELTFTHATWDQIHADLEKSHKDKKIVGWYHTHPGFGIFLSDRDQFIHKSFFNLPFQVALVYDPKSREHGVFAWRDNEPQRLRRWFVGEREQTWDGPRSLPDLKREPAEKKTKETDMKDDKSEPAGPMDWGTMAIAGLVLLLIGGFIGWWFGGRDASSAIAQAQTQMQVEAVKAKAAGMEEAVHGLNAELLQAVKTLMAPSDDAKQPLADLDAAMKATPPDVAKMQAALAKLRSIDDERASLSATIGGLEKVLAARREVDPEQVFRDAHALAVLYADSANDLVKSGDKDRAIRYLMTAASIDPTDIARYDQQIKSIDPSKSVAPPPDPGVKP